jgi:hypothetical protein
MVCKTLSPFTESTADTSINTSLGDLAAPIAPVIAQPKRIATRPAAPCPKLLQPVLENADAVPGRAHRTAIHRYNCPIELGLRGSEKKEARREGRDVLIFAMLRCGYVRPAGDRGGCVVALPVRRRRQSVRARHNLPFALTPFSFRKLRRPIGVAKKNRTPPREQRNLAEASSVSLPTIKRLESRPGPLAAHTSTVAALRRALEAAGIEFTNGDQPGVRLRQIRRKD